ncbi:coiled-coil domain-containing protein 130 homolog isoform X2 [Clupea harengus]|uniref:Probable splicing factor YJU2B n=1 Tax=Clupea harengus TaxID=7950 RepID=A0A6P8EUF2_CLUHA|nr:coiled-coil domain-containing protein 130 homolog isoform X2 [Clupea harengus]
MLARDVVVSSQDMVMVVSIPTKQACYICNISYLTQYHRGGIFALNITALLLVRTPPLQLKTNRSLFHIVFKSLRRGSAVNMGERKGVNKYYPPDFDPAKHGSLNGYNNSHPLRERARKLSQGILIIRFEMPYNIWCDGCKNHIGMGVRYNAEKKKVGNYYTTPIYRFRMKCHLCVNYIEMQTDPANCDYVIVSGAQRKEERWDMAENEQILTTEHSEKQKLETDPMYKLDHGGKDKEKLRAALPSLTEIQTHQSAWRDDFNLNSSLRRKFRDEKKVIAEQEEKDNAVKMRAGLSITLVPEKEEDKRLAALLTFQSSDSYDDRQQSKRKEIASRSWFNSPISTPGSAAGSLLHKLGLQGKEAAATKALSSPATSALSLVRRRSGDPRPESSSSLASAPSAPQRRDSDPERGATATDLHETGESTGTDLNVTQMTQKGKDTFGVETFGYSNASRDTSTSNMTGGSSEGGDCGPKEDHASSSSVVRSLVADYSDSDPDTDNSEP